MLAGCEVAMAVGAGAVGFLGASLSVRPVLRGLRTSLWPATQGVVVSSGYSTRENSDASRQWEVSVLYCYQVAGRSFVGSTVRIGGGPSYPTSGTATCRAASQWPEGKRVTVFYNPTSPGEAVLCRGPHPIGTFVLGVSLTIAILSAVTLTRV